MDPNETIARLRELLGGDHSGYYANREGTAIRHDTTGKEAVDLEGLHSQLCETEELFQALDSWLRSGGPLPVRWKGANMLRPLDEQGTCRRCGAGGQP